MIAVRVTSISVKLIRITLNGENYEMWSCAWQNGGARGNDFIVVVVIVVVLWCERERASSL